VGSQRPRDTHEIDRTLPPGLRRMVLRTATGRCHARICTDFAAPRPSRYRFTRRRRSPVVAAGRAPSAAS
jgi:hypothetical protein